MTGVVERSGARCDTSTHEAKVNSIFVFYGFSGNPRLPVPSFPNGIDHDGSYRLVAETLGVSIKKLFPHDNIRVQQAWTKDIILQTLESAVEPIRQVHVVSHANPTRLSLAYRYDGNARLRTLALKHNTLNHSSDELAINAMREDDALVAGFLANALEKSRLAKIKSNHLYGANWQIWGCYAGCATARFEGIGDPDIDSYFERLNFDMLEVPSIAIDIARSLGVICTAAYGGSGLEFWHRLSTGETMRNNTNTPNRMPFWLWPAKRSRWISFDPSGNVLPKPVIFEQPRRRLVFSSTRPPKWLTELC